MSCKPPDTKPEPESVGFFASLFGFGGSSEEETISPSCTPGCGTCGGVNGCHCALKAHLKECCQYGEYPSLFKCSAIKPNLNRDDPKTLVDTSCGFPPVNTNCEETINRDSGRNLACSAKPKSFTCPPLPETDTTACIPLWICPEPSKTDKTYKAPRDAEIRPMSASGRASSRKGELPCPECGSTSQPDLLAPMVSNKGCPALIIDCKSKHSSKLNPVVDTDQRLMHKIIAWITCKRKGEWAANQFQNVCKALKVEDEQIRHHRDVFNPTLLIRGDGYMQPIFRVQCAGCSPPEDDDDCDCDDCIAERASSTCLTARESIHLCFECRSKENTNFVTPDKTFGDFVCPPGMEIVPKCPEETIDTSCVPYEEPDCQEEQVQYECPEDNFYYASQEPTVDECLQGGDVFDYGQNELQYDDQTECTRLDGIVETELQQFDDNCEGGEELYQDFYMPVTAEDSSADCCCEDLPECPPGESDIAIQENDLEVCEEVIATDPCPDPVQEVSDDCEVQVINEDCPCDPVSDTVGAGICDDASDVEFKCEQCQPLPPCPEVEKCKSLLEELDKLACASASDIRKSFHKEDCKCDCFDPTNTASSADIEFKCPELQTEDIEFKCPAEEQSTDIEFKCPAEEQTADIEFKCPTISNKVAECQTVQKICNLECIEPKVVKPICSKPPLQCGTCGEIKLNESTCKPVIPRDCKVKDEPIPKFGSTFNTKCIDSFPTDEMYEKNRRFLDNECQCRNCNTEEEVNGFSQGRFAINTCRKCGDATGLNNACPLCRFTNASNIRNQNKLELSDGKIEPDCESKEFEVKKDGKPIYEGGMCITRAQFFLWKNADEENSKSGKGNSNDSTCLEDKDDEECNCEECTKKC